MATQHVAPLAPHAPTLRVQADMPVQIGNWDLVRMLGSGADADVFLAQHRQNGRKVAVKLVRHNSTSFYDRRRHLDEIRAVIAIDHRNVVKLYEAGELDDRRIYLVMEHLEGRTLRSVLDERGTLGTNVLLQIGLLVARGLSAAHARGIVHRDLKPSNVMVIPSDGGRFTIKLIDFGIAKFVDGKVTTIIGTPAYMSPEQERGDAIDHRADIFSFGILMHHASTGGYPDRERPEVAIARASAGECTLQTIIDRCLRRDSSQRFPTTAHLIAELETARSRLKRSRVARGTPDESITSWWRSEDSVFSMHQRGAERRPSDMASTSIRLNVVPQPSAPRMPPPPTPQPRARPASPSPVPPFAGPNVDVSGVLISPSLHQPPERQPSLAPSPMFAAAGAASLPAVASEDRRPLREVLALIAPAAHAVVKRIEGRTRVLIIAMIALGIMLGAVLPMLRRGDDPPPPAAATPVAAPRAPARPVAAAPPAPAPVARDACAPEPARTALPSRAAASWLAKPDEPRKVRKGKRRAPRRAAEDEIEIQSDDPE